MYNFLTYLLPSFLSPSFFLIMQTDLTQTLKLQAFTCRQVDVSFAVVSNTTVSQYSPVTRTCIIGKTYTYLWLHMHCYTQVVMVIHTLLHTRCYGYTRIVTHRLLRLNTHCYGILFVNSVYTHQIV